MGMMLHQGIAKEGDPHPLEAVGATAVFVPYGFDDNDHIQVVIEGWYPDNSHQWSPAKWTWENDKTIFIQPQARIHRDGIILPYMVRYEEVINLGLLDKGDYRVVVGNEEVAATLVVQKAPKDTIDNYIYAPVESVRVIDREKRIVRLEGTFTNPCMRIKEVIPTEPVNQVVAILPIVEEMDSGEQQLCEGEGKHFSEDVILNHEDIQGRMLIHVRKLNGQSKNLIVDF